MARACVFCGATPVTNEHVWARWITELLLPIKPENATGIRGTRERRTSEAVWYSNEIGTKVKHFCGPICNNGWMSALEGEVQPILAPLILGEPTTLGEVEQDVLARWAYKTALVADFTYPANHPKRPAWNTPIPPHTYRQFFETRKVPSPGVIIWIAGYSGSRIAQCARIAHGFSPTPDDALADRFAYVITIGVGAVVLQVMGHLSGDWQPDRPRYFADPFTHIWPPRNTPVEWPPGRGTLTEQGFDSFATRPQF